MGAFRFNNAASGEAFLTVQVDGYAPEMKRIEPDKDTALVEFRLEPVTSSAAGRRYADQCAGWRVRVR